jgi:hypothetical protein
VLAMTVALFLPVVAGTYAVRMAWPAGPIVLRLSLGAILGTGAAGTVYGLALLLSDSARISLIATEAVVGFVLVMTFVRRLPVASRSVNGEGPSGVYGWAFLVMLLMAATAFALAVDASHHGGWDAFAMWNLKARLIASSPTSPLSAILDQAFLGLHPDYPLLLPSLLSRGWQYAGLAAVAPPILIAALFTIAAITLTIGGIRSLSTVPQSWVSGILLLGTPFLLRHGASQYADIVLCCFVTAAVVLYCLYDGDPTNTHLPFLAGIAAAAAAFTKNEGILFLVVLGLARIVRLVLRQPEKGGSHELLRFAAGASLGVSALVTFKLLLAPRSEFVAGITPQVFVARVLNPARHLEVLRGIRDGLSFGQWSMNPLPLMALHAAAASTGNTHRQPRFTAAFTIVGMLCGFYVLYLVSPYDVEYHVRSSLDRLMLQLWPSILLLYSMTAAPRAAVPSTASSATVGLRIAVVLVLISSIVTWSLIDAERPGGVNASPRIELSRTQVTTGDTYVIRLTGVASSQVFISYSLDGKPMGQFDVYLGRDGTAEFPISEGTRKGTYRFLAVRDPNSPEWTSFVTAAAITVK